MAVLLHKQAKVWYSFSETVSVVIVPPVQRHREYILRAALLFVTGALTINPVSIFNGNIACFGMC